MVVSNNVKVLRPRTIKCQEWWISGNFAISQTKIWNFTDKTVLLLSSWKCVHVQCWCVAHFGLIMDIISVEENWVAGGSWSDEMERPRQWSNSFKRLQKCFCSSSRMKSHFHLLILVIAFPVYSFRRTLLWFKKQQDWIDFLWKMVCLQVLILFVQVNIGVTREQRAMWTALSSAVDNLKLP